MCSVGKVSCSLFPFICSQRGTICRTVDGGSWNLYKWAWLSVSLGAAACCHSQSHFRRGTISYDHIHHRYVLSSLSGIILRYKIKSAHQYLIACWWTVAPHRNAIFTLQQTIHEPTFLTCSKISEPSHKGKQLWLSQALSWEIHICVKLCKWCQRVVCKKND